MSATTNHQARRFNAAEATEWFNSRNVESHGHLRQHVSMQPKPQNGLIEVRISSYRFWELSFNAAEATEWFNRHILLQERKIYL